MNKTRVCIEQEVIRRVDNTKQMVDAEYGTSFRPPICTLRIGVIK